ncbi:hypothetical protein Asp14428_61770 [Actinoplanes sp. NBRC 14428]|uniref:Uncharacterized protein n=1 Tax=Pseudosporangium ferrugineum TaxID=439699 RepID=A0A2T0SCX3_9ACTN|nr:hypothetical protein [Pseudosporangium ferrugineum]PRY31173.1 hypothetical protein CLV70_10357 [Pseudosporangium ferrugineum]BCJ54702.1 hypothetical protein Asp14428_61770 [Actinoplanes sp. NBRC 14428]
MVDNGLSEEDDMGKAVAYLVATIAGVIVVGWIAISLLHVLVGALSYLIVGAIVVGGGVYLYGKAKKGLAPGTRTQRRIEAAAKTYRMRNR